MSWPEVFEVDWDMILTEAAIGVTGLAAVVATWVERDVERPVRWAYILSALIVSATGVSMYQSWSDAASKQKMEDNLARLMERLDHVGQGEDVEVPKINDLMKNEITTMGRSSPRVVTMMAQRVADEGGNPEEMLGAYLPPSELLALKRGGSLTTKGTAGLTGPPRRPMTFGQGPAQVRADAPDAVVPRAAPDPAAQPRRIGGGAASARAASSGAGATPAEGSASPDASAATAGSASAAGSASPGASAAPATSASAPASPGASAAAGAPASPGASAAAGASASPGASASASASPGASAARPPRAPLPGKKPLPSGKAQERDVYNEAESERRSAH
jgi:hypothetical protein